MHDEHSSSEIIPPSKEASATSDHNKWVRGALNAAGGAIPFAGGLLAAAAGIWSETEQGRALEALRAWVQMLEDEIREKQRTILDVVARLDMHDDEIAAFTRARE